VLSYGENPESVSHLGLIRYRVVTPGRTDGRTELRQLIRAKHYVQSRVKTRYLEQRPTSPVTPTGKTIYGELKLRS